MAGSESSLSRVIEIDPSLARTGVRVLETGSPGGDTVLGEPPPFQHLPLWVRALPTKARKGAAAFHGLGRQAVDVFADVFLADVGLGG